MASVPDLPTSEEQQADEVIARLDAVRVWLAGCRVALEASPDLSRKIVALIESEASDA